LNDNPNVTLADQAAALSALALLARQNPGLPSASLSVYDSASISGTASAFLHSPAAIEAWRVALDWPTSVMYLRVHGDAVWLEMDSLFLGVRLHVTMHSVLVAAEVASVSPAEDEVRQSALVSLPSAWRAAAVSA
jgi:hypothetical protein